MKKFFTVKNIAGLGILSALVIVLQLLANFVTFGPVSITLSLIPIAVGACIYGPIAGLLLGFVNGVLVLVAPSTLTIFMPVAPLGTFVTCLLKSTIAGGFAGLIFSLFEKKHPYVGAIISSVLVPIINTGLFVLFAQIFFVGKLENITTDGSAVTLSYIIVSMIGINFIFEFLVNSILSPVVFTIYKYFKNRN